MSLRSKIHSHKSIAESFFSLSILNVLNVFLPFITLPYILRVIGASNYGVYSYVYVLIQYLMLINAYGFNLSATKQISQHREDKHQVSVIYNSVIICRIILLAVGILFFLILSPFLLESESKRLMFLMGLGIVLGDLLNPVWLFQGFEKMRYMTIVNIISKTLFTILIFFVIRTADDYIYILLINSCGFILAGFISTIIAKKQFDIKFFIPSINDIRFQFKSGFALFGSTIGTNLYSNANIFILNFFVSESAVGVYAAAEKIIKGLQMSTSPITQALFPFFSKDFHNKALQYQLNRLTKIVKLFVLILIVPNIVIFFGAELLVRIFCGPSGYDESVLLVKIMSPVFLLGTLNYLLGIIGLVNLNKQRYFFQGVLLSGIISIVFLIFAVPYFGIKAASMAIPLSELVLLIVLIYYFIKIRKSEGAR